MKDDSEKKDIPGPSTDNIQYEVTPEGSLGLLALGHIGLRLWREKRKEHFQKLTAEQNQKKDTQENEK